MQYEVYLDVLFLEKYDDGFSDSSGSKKKYFHVLPLMEVFLPVPLTGSLLTCAILFFPCRYGPAYPAVFPGKFPV